MGTALSIEEAFALLRSREDLLHRGWTERAISAAVSSHRLRRIRRGAFVDAAEWEQLWPESRHLLHACAVSRASGGRVVLSHASAAVVHGLPLYRASPERVHATFAAPVRVSSSPDVLRHVATLTSEEITEVDGMRCTSLGRTVFDVLRTERRETALAVADAAERARSVDGQRVDQEARWSWREQMEARLAENAGARGIRRARELHGIADGRAHLPGESVMRLQLIRLGFAPPRLQVPVPGPRGTYFVDGALDEAAAFYEFDGKTKYRDEAMRSGRTIDEVLLAEKQREDWIRGVTGRALVRASDEHIATPELLAQRLRAFHIPLPR